ncbi:MAG: WD40 repeat domain-containing protein [Myxococcales bacterium]|nr:WD40 repeat domain-containing protein [Myxococcales bacterium]
MRLPTLAASLLLASCASAAPAVSSKPTAPPAVSLPEIGERVIELGPGGADFPSALVLAALSDDGAQLAVVDDQGKVRVRGTAASGPGAEIGTVQLAGDREPGGITFSPDARLVAVNDFKEGVVVFDVMRRTRARVISRSGGLVAPVFTSNETLLVADGATIREVDVKTGSDLRSLTVAGERSSLRSVANAPGSGAIAACSFDRVVVFSKEGRVVFEKADKYPSAVALSRDGTTLAYAMTTGSSGVFVVDLPSGAQKLHAVGSDDVSGLWLTHDSVLSLASRRGSHATLERVLFGGGKKRYDADATVEVGVAAVSASGTAVVAARGTELFSVDPTTFDRTGAARRHGEAVSWLGVSADDRFLVSSGRDGKVLRWSLEKPASAPKVLFDKKGAEAHRFALSPDGRLVAHDARESEYGGGARVVDLATGDVVHDLPTDWVSGLAFEGDKRLWIATTRGDIEAWDLASGERDLAAPLTPESDGTLDSKYWNGNLLSPRSVVFRERSILREEETKGQALAFTIPAGLPSGKIDDVGLACRPVSEAEIVCPGAVRTTAGGETSYVLRFIEVATGKARLVPAPGWVQALAPSTDGAEIAVVTSVADAEPTAATKVALVLLDARTGKERTRRPLTESATSLAITRSGYVLVGRESGTIHMMKP